MNTCTKVFLRKKAISGGRISLYLDFYLAIRNPHTNRMSRRETLGIYIYASPKNEREKQFNASMEEKAEAIRCRRFEQRDSIKTETVKREETGIPFHNFQPHDDWKPEAPHSKTERPNPQKEAEIDRFPLPHQRKSRLTPGEIQAIKDIRANPHIPEDAKPELPEGYE